MIRYSMRIDFIAGSKLRHLKKKNFYAQYSGEIIKGLLTAGKLSGLTYLSNVIGAKLIQ